MKKQFFFFATVILFFAFLYRQAVTAQPTKAEALLTYNTSAVITPLATQDLQSNLFFLFTGNRIADHTLNANLQDDIDQLIEQLGDNDPAVREKAQSELIKKIKEADEDEKKAILKKIRKALTDPDVERQLRARAILVAIRTTAGEVSFETNSATDGEITLTIELENGRGDNVCLVNTTVGGDYTPELKLQQLEEAIEGSRDPDCKGIRIVDISKTTLVFRAKGRDAKIKNIKLEDNSVQETNTGIFDIDSLNHIWRARCLIFPLVSAIPALPTTVSLRINGEKAKVSSTDKCGNPRSVKAIAQDIFHILCGPKFKNQRNEGLVISLDNPAFTFTAPFDIILAFEPAQTVNAIVSVGIIPNSAGRTKARPSAQPVTATQERSEKNEVLTKKAERNVSGAYLEQNKPNPHSGNTIIYYHLPQNTGTAKIVITNINGGVIKIMALTGKGDGQIIFNTGTLAAGSYTYSLWANGKQVDAKQMVIIK